MAEDSKRIHLKLLTDIVDLIDTTSTDCEKFITHMGRFLAKGELARNPTLLGKLKAMETKGDLGVRNYGNLKQVAEDSGNMDVHELIIKAEKEILKINLGKDENTGKGKGKAAAKGKTRIKNRKVKTDTPTMSKRKREDLGVEKNQKKHKGLLGDHADVNVASTSEYIPRENIDRETLKEFQKDLIQWYKDDCLTIPINPLIQLETADIEDLFAEPCMMRVDPHNNTSEPVTLDEYPRRMTITEIQEQEGKKVKSYADIFKNGTEECRKIYVTGNAGMGKSTLCQHLVATWCRAHSKNTEAEPMTKDEECMKKFYFVFYILLRDVTGSHNQVEDMIKDQLLKRIDDSYTSILIKVLQTETCLLILDGLDEWTRTNDSEKSRRVSKGLPDRTVRRKCTIITTTRPWKLEIHRLKSSDIDQQIELKGLDEKSSLQLIANAITVLNKRYGCKKSVDDFQKNLKESNVTELACIRMIHIKLKRLEKRLDKKSASQLMVNAITVYNKRKSFQKSVDDFQKNLKESNVTELACIPVMLKQLLCLWHSGKTLGNSKCSIYSGMINHLIQLAEDKHNLKSNLEYADIKNVSAVLQFPKCFDGNKKCEELKPFIYALAKLSFETLFTHNSEESLVFERSIAEIHGMSKQQIDISLKVGILSQSKILIDCNTESKKISFIHKTFQEYLAALYVSMNEDAIETVTNICNSIEKIFKMEQVLVFISGMNPDIARKLSEHICEVVFHNGLNLQQYRHTLEDSFLDCHVHVREGFLDCHVHVREGFLDRHVHVREALRIQETISNMVREGLNSGHPTNLKFEDVFISRQTELTPNLENMILSCSRNIKSLYINTDVACRLTKANVQVDSLQKLYIESYFGIRNMVYSPKEGVYDLVRKSKDTLQCLMLKGHMNRKLELSQQQFSSMIQPLSNLIALKFAGMTLAHNQVECLMSFLSQSIHMKHIYLDSITCSECEYRTCSECLEIMEEELESMQAPCKKPISVCTYKLDLTQNAQLTTLNLNKLNVESIQVNTTNLTELFISNLRLRGTLASVANDIRNAPRLQRLSLDQPEELIDSSIEQEKLVYNKECTYKLDLSQNAQLTTLNLNNLNVESIKVNTTSLTELSISNLQVPGALSSVLDDLLNAPKLKRLSLHVGKLSIHVGNYNGYGYTQLLSMDVDRLLEIIPSLEQLKRIDLGNIDFGDREFRVSGKIHYVILSEVAMPINSFYSFIDSLLTAGEDPNEKLDVQLEGIIINPAVEKKAALDYVSNFERFYVPVLLLNVLQFRKCFDGNIKCEELKPCIYALAKLSFEKLFTHNSEESLVIQRSITEIHGIHGIHGMSKQHIDISVKVGILSRMKLTTRHNETKSEKISFIHKTFMEYLAALYVSMNEDAIETVTDICNSIEKIFKMEQVLVFISGMNPDIARKLSEHICEVVFQNGLNLQQYRHTIDDSILDRDWSCQVFDRPDTVREALRIQETISNMVREGLNSGHPTNLKFEDVFISREAELTPNLENMILSCSRNIKSLYINTDVACRLSKANVQFDSLQKLYIESYFGIRNMVYSPEECVYDLVRKSKDTLQCLMLKGHMNRKLELSQQQFSSMIQPLSNLIALKFAGMTLAHNQVECLMSFLSQSIHMKHIYLDSIKCSECEYRMCSKRLEIMEKEPESMQAPCEKPISVCRYKLNLSQNAQLTTLNLNKLNVESIQVNTTSLTELFISNLRLRGTLASVANDIRNAPRLQRLSLDQPEELIDSSIEQEKLVYSKECTYKLDLSQNAQLTTLALNKLNVESIQVNTTSLTELSISNLLVPGAWASVLDVLLNAPKLEQLNLDVNTQLQESIDVDRLLEMIPTLEQLKRIDLGNIDLGDRKFRISGKTEYEKQ